MGRPRKIKQTEEVQMSEELEQEKIASELDVMRLELEKAKIELEERKREIESLSSRPYDEEESEISDKQINVSLNKAELKKKIERQKYIDNQPVTGKFMNRRAPGQSVKLPYIKYEDDPVKWHYFEEGKVYTIPRGFADQINEYYNTPTFKQKMGEQSHSNIVGENSAIAHVDTSKKNYAFVPVGF